jgi:hypothetical protein
MSDYQTRGASSAERRKRTRARLRVGSAPRQLIAWVVDLFQDDEDATANFEIESRQFISSALHGALQLGDFTAKDWKALRTDVASGFRQVAAGEEWRLPLEDLKGHEHIASAGRAPGHGPGRALFLLACERVLSLDGKRLRICRDSDCGRLFVRQKRQAFCSTKCLRNERNRRTRQNLTPEKLRARRHRYYVNRVAKLKGKKVASHVHERPRRPPELPRKGRQESARQAQGIARTLALAERHPSLRKGLDAFLDECPNKRTLREHIEGRFEHCVGIYRTKESAEGPGLECVKDALVSFGGTQSRFPRSPAQTFLLEKTKRTERADSEAMPRRGKHQRQKTSAARPTCQALRRTRK